MERGVINVKAKRVDKKIICFSTAYKFVFFSWRNYYFSLISFINNHIKVKYYKLKLTPYAAYINISIAVITHQYLFVNSDFVVIILTYSINSEIGHGEIK